MATVTSEQIQVVEDLLSLLERINNLEKRATIGSDLAERARTKINTELDSYFPPPAP